MGGSLRLPLVDRLRLEAGNYLQAAQSFEHWVCARGPAKAPIPTLVELVALAGACLCEGDWKQRRY